MNLKLMSQQDDVSVEARLIVLAGRFMALRFQLDKVQVVLFVGIQSAHFWRCFGVRELQLLRRRPTPISCFQMM